MRRRKALRRRGGIFDQPRPLVDPLAQAVERTVRRGPKPGGGADSGVASAVAAFDDWLVTRLATHPPSCTTSALFVALTALEPSTAPDLLREKLDRSLFRLRLRGRIANDAPDVWRVAS